MYEVILTIALAPGSHGTVLAPARRRSRRRPGPSPVVSPATSPPAPTTPTKLDFVEAWTDEAAQAVHMEQQHSKDRIAFHEPFDRKPTVETINPAG